MKKSFFKVEIDIGHRISGETNQHGEAPQCESNHKQCAKE